MVEEWPSDVVHTEVGGGGVVLAALMVGWVIIRLRYSSCGRNGRI